MNKFLPYWNHLLTGVYCASSAYAGYELIKVGHMVGGIASIYTGVVFYLYYHLFICTQEKRITALINRKEETIKKMERLYEAFRPKADNHEL